MLSEKDIILTAYGNDENKEKGLVIISITGEKKHFPINGKANCCIRDGQNLFVPVQEESGNYLYDFQYREGKLILQDRFNTRYFYSHGLVIPGLLLLASFESGVDAVFDLDSKCETSFFKHFRDNYDFGGRSHYIGLTADKNVYAVDNALNQIITYKMVENKLEEANVLEFGSENIRLMPYSSFADHYYLNTEKTNSIIGLQYKRGGFTIRYRYQICSDQNSSTGGNAVSPDGRRICVTLRGANQLNYYEIQGDGSLELLDCVSCGDMPRDISFHEDAVLVTCTDANRVEIYREIDRKLVRTMNVPVCSPVTFSI